jgi:chemotaxis protein histidine kinase CheA
MVAAVQQHVEEDNEIAQSLDDGEYQDGHDADAAEDGKENPNKYVVCSRHVRTFMHLEKVQNPRRGAIESGRKFIEVLVWNYIERAIRRMRKEGRTQISTEDMAWAVTPALNIAGGTIENQREAHKEKKEKRDLKRQEKKEKSLADAKEAEEEAVPRATPKKASKKAAKPAAAAAAPTSSKKKASASADAAPATKRKAAAPADAADAPAKKVKTAASTAAAPAKKTKVAKAEVVQTVQKKADKAAAPKVAGTKKASSKKAAEKFVDESLED